MLASLVGLTACVGGTAPQATPTVPVVAQPTSAPAVASPEAAIGPLPIADPAVHVFVWGSDAQTTDRDLQLAKDGGFNWVKQRFEWRNIEGKGKGQFEWNEPDRILDAVEAHGLKVIARVDNQPQWASSSITWPGSGPPDKLSDWTDYLTALATRYKGRIQAYEIWNEPNLDIEWGGNPPDPAAYTRLLKASYEAIKAVDPDATVTTAGLSPTTTENEHAMRDIDFYRGDVPGRGEGKLRRAGRQRGRLQGAALQRPERGGHHPRPEQSERPEPA